MHLDNKRREAQLSKYGMYPKNLIKVSSKFHGSQVAAAKTISRSWLYDTYGVMKNTVDSICNAIGPIVFT